MWNIYKKFTSHLTVNTHSVHYKKKNQLFTQDTLQRADSFARAFESESILGARLISKELSQVITPESRRLFIKCAQPNTSCSSDPISGPIYYPSAMKADGSKGFVSMLPRSQSNSPFSDALKEKSMFQANAIMGLAFVMQRHVTCVKYQDWGKCDYVSVGTQRDVEKQRYLCLSRKRRIHVYVFVKIQLSDIE